MSILSPTPTSSHLALSLLSAQAGPGGASASVTSAEVTTGKATGERSGRSDINAIADAKAERFQARIDDAQEEFDYQNKTSLARRKAEASERQILRIKKRTQQMSNALQRLGAGPLSEGQRIVSLFSNAGAGAVTIQSTGQVDSVYLRGGDQALAISAQSATSIYTGAGHDAVAIQADFVDGVSTERSDGYEAAYRDTGEVYAKRVHKSSSNDAVAIQARWAESIYTGGGNDAVAVDADMVASIYAGAGQDAVSVRGGVVSGIHGGEGRDTITVNAAIGYSVFRNLRASAADYNADPSPDYQRPTNAEDRMRLAATNYADIQGGTGDDAISVTVEEVLSINGGSGDDVISIGGGTVGLRVGAGSGDDIVQVARGAELVVQIDRGGYAVEIDGADMVIRHAGGSVRVAGYENAAAIGVTRFGAAQHRADPAPGSPEAQRMADHQRLMNDVTQTAQRVEMTDLKLATPTRDLGFEIARPSEFDMLHLAPGPPLERWV